MVYCSTKQNGMKPLKPHQVRGNWATLFHTTDQQGIIDYTKLTDEIDILIASKPIGIYSNGLTGKLYTQTKKEFDKICQLLAEECNATAVPFQKSIPIKSNRQSGI